MTEQELNKKLADPKLSPQQKKKLQDEYNRANHLQSP